MRHVPAFLPNSYLPVYIRVFPLAALDILFFGPFPENPTSAAGLSGQLRVFARIPALAQNLRASSPLAVWGLRGCLLERLSRPSGRFFDPFQAPSKTTCRKMTRRPSRHLFPKPVDRPRLFRPRGRPCFPGNLSRARLLTVFRSPVPDRLRSAFRPLRFLLFYLPFSPFRGIEKLYPHICKDVPDFIRLLPVFRQARGIPVDD